MIFYNQYLYILFHSSYNTLSCFYTSSLAIVNHTLHFSNNNYNISARINQHASSYVGMVVIKCVPFYQIKAGHATGWLLSFSGTFSMGLLESS